MPINVSVVCLFLGVFFSCPATADNSACTAEAVFGFADYLERSGDYYRAITEYRRLVYHWPDHRFAPESRYRIGRSYLRGHDYQKAETVFLDLLAEPFPLNDPIRIRYRLAQAYYSAGDWNRSHQQLLLLEQFSNSLPAPPLSYTRLWCYLKPGRMTEAKSYWDTVDTGDADAHMSSAGTIRRHLEEMSKRSRKNPRLAGVLSAAIPGLGQVYAGRPRNGLVSFLINGLFIGAIAVAVEKGHNETAAVLVFFEAGFYTANIYNAVNDAHKTNRFRHEQDLIRFENMFGPAFSHEYSPFDP